MQVHASCVARDGAGLLLLGPSGAGKSDLALRLIGRGFVLVADDRVEIDERGAARPPASLAGILEVRGIGLLRLPHEAPVRLALALELGGGDPPPRLPPAAGTSPVAGVPLLAFDPWEVSAPEKAAFALAAACGALAMVAGAFA